jgi:ornithine carbamoyltransferase
MLRRTHTSSALRHLTKISDLSPAEFRSMLESARAMKARPQDYSTVMKDKTLLMLFEKPSLRTRVSFETGMTQMGGHAIFYSIADSPLGKKETIGDTVQVLNRYVDVVMARVNRREDTREMARLSSIPIINALDDYAHPCQMLADYLTIAEKKGFDNLRQLRVAYVGDCKNNVTYDLMRGGLLLGATVAVAGPRGPDFDIEPSVLEECKALKELEVGSFEVHHSAADAVAGADVVYTDSWMSYHISGDLAKKRVETFQPFQVTSDLMAKAKPDCIFMNCLPAMRGQEQTADVIDGPQSVVFDQAENRLHGQKALLKWLTQAE